MNVAFPQTLRRPAAALVVAFAIAPIALAAAACATPGTPPTVAPELGVDFSAMYRLPGGLWVEDVRTGWGDAAHPGDIVVVHYTGWIANGTQFDSSRDTGEPLVTEIGEDSPLIEGWNKGLEGMRVGGRRKLVIPSRLAYGNTGVRGVVPPNATLVFDLELMDVQRR